LDRQTTLVNDISHQHEISVGQKEVEMGETYEKSSRCPEANAEKESRIFGTKARAEESGELWRR
jgi:hypothetical protein